MTASRIAPLLALLVVLGVPLALRPEASREEPVPADDTLIVVTPHVQQIRDEVSLGFDRWHRARFGRPARIDWRVPGGTTEIIRVLQAQFSAATASGRLAVARDGGIAAPAGSIGFDVMLGGGSYDHGRLKDGLTLRLRDARGEAFERRVPMSVPAGFEPDQLEAWFGVNSIGPQRLHDPEQFWLGTALSGFGIVFNREVLGRLGLPEPRSFADLADPRYAGWIVLADPRQSGSITTAFESVLNVFGWDVGWRILRSMGANARTWTNSATKPPIDVAQGEAAAALAIDFYGRSQAAAIPDGRVGYVDPPGEVYVDADPVSILRGGPNPALARRFVEFCLSEAGQALWCFAPRSGARADVGGEAPAGPSRSALHRLPVRRSMYERYADLMVDRVNPFDVAGSHPSRGLRASIGPIMGASSIDSAEEQRAAWRALIAAIARDGPESSRVREMREAFFAWPDVTMPGGTRIAFGAATQGAITEAWRRDRGFAARSRIEMTAFFRASYRRVTDLAARD